MFHAAIHAVSVVEDGTTLASFDIANEAYTARITFLIGIVESSFGWKTNVLRAHFRRGLRLDLVA